VKPGEERLKEVIRKQKARTRQDDPRPYDADWGWWVESRLHRLETGQLWLIRIAGAALAAQILRLLWDAVGLVP